MNLGTPKRKSRRLSGALPELTLDQAASAINSPRTRNLRGKNTEPRTPTCSGTQNFKAVAEEVIEEALEPVIEADKGDIEEHEVVKVASDREATAVEQEVVDREATAVEQEVVDREATAVEQEGVDREDTAVEQEVVDREATAVEQEGVDREDTAVEQEGVDEHEGSPRAVAETAIALDSEHLIGDETDDEKKWSRKDLKAVVEGVVEAPEAVGQTLRIVEKENTNPKKPTKVMMPPPRQGRIKSGRFWKADRDRFRSVIKSKGLKTSYEQRKRQKEATQRAKDLEKAMKEEKKAKLEDLKKRREENLKRREENERKAEIVQTIKNPAKIKRMKKKQLRKVVKRDTMVLNKSYA